MSGNLLTGLTRVSSGIATGAADLQGLFGTPSGVTLGSVTLSNFEIPSSIHVVDKQAYALHKLFGGQRVLNDLGPDPDPITWQGILLGNYANSRAQALMALKNQARLITLTWASFSFQVFIERFEIDAGYAYIPYVISCVIVPPNPSSASSTTASSLQTSVLGSLGAGLKAIGGAASAVASAASATVGVAQQAIGTASAFAGAFGVNSPGLSTLSRSLVSVQSVAGSVQGLAEGSSVVGNLLGSTTNIVGNLRSDITSAGTAIENGFTGTATSIVQSAGSTGMLAYLSQAEGRIGEAAVNLGLSAAQPQSPSAVNTSINTGAGVLSPTAPTPNFLVQ